VNLTLILHPTHIKQISSYDSNGEPSQFSSEELGRAQERAEERKRRSENGGENESKVEDDHGSCSPKWMEGWIIVSPVNARSLGPGHEPTVYI